MNNDYLEGERGKNNNKMELFFIRIGFFELKIF